MFVINTKDDTPVYIQLQDQVLEYIALGIFQKDDQLPSVRTLSKELGINPNTVAKAYANLEMQGYVYTKPAKGVFVNAENVSEMVYGKKIEELKTKMTDCRNIGISKDTLIQIIDEIYKEDKEDVKS